MARTGFGVVDLDVQRLPDKNTFPILGWVIIIVLIMTIATRDVTLLGWPARYVIRIPTRCRSPRCTAQSHKPFRRQLEFSAGRAW